MGKLATGLIRSVAPGAGEELFAENTTVRIKGVLMNNGNASASTVVTIETVGGTVLAVCSLQAETCIWFPVGYVSTDGLVATASGGGAAGASVYVYYYES